MADIAYSIDKANCPNSYYASVFGCERLAVFGRNKSIGLDGIPGKILKLGGKAMIPYLVRLLDIAFTMLLLQETGKEPLWFLFTRGKIDWFTIYRPVSLTSLVCKQMEQVIAGYLRQVWDMN
jgi:hypothetical protein